MKTVTRELHYRLIKKAQTSRCKYKISAMGFDNKGELIHVTRNTTRFNRQGGSVHAEMKLMREFGDKIKVIIICRTNMNGDLKLIHPCKACARKANELDIKIMSICDI